MIAAGSEAFYALPEKTKAAYYPLHVTVHGERYDGYNPAVFYQTEKGLTVTRARSSDEGVLLNPFLPEDREAILDGLKSGFTYNKYDTDITDDLDKTIPELAKPVEAAIAAKEKRKREEALKAERLKNPLAKTAGGHAKNRVHVSGVKI